MSWYYHYYIKHTHGFPSGFQSFLQDRTEVTRDNLADMAHINDVGGGGSFEIANQQQMLSALPGLLVIIIVTVVS